MSNNCVVMFSGGVGSWGAARRAADRFGAENTTLLFADTLMEDQDLYRFLDESAALIGATLVKIADGRDPWQVFHDVRFLGNTRIDPCSRVLKRDLMRSWVEEHFSPDDTTIVMGIDWTEIHRFERAQPRWEPWTLWAPLCDEPYVDKADLIGALAEAGVEPPRLYALGFPHNNCGGFCVKAGQAQFRLLLEKLPERYAEHEAKEAELGVYLGKKISVLRDRRGGTTKPMTLTEFREHIEAGQKTEDEWGGCGCAVD